MDKMVKLRDDLTPHHSDLLSYSNSSKWQSMTFGLNLRSIENKKERTKSKWYLCVCGSPILLRLPSAYEFGQSVDQFEIKMEEREYYQNRKVKIRAMQSVIVDKFDVNVWVKQTNWLYYKNQIPITFHDNRKRIPQNNILKKGKINPNWFVGNQRKLIIHDKWESNWVIQIEVKNWQKDLRLVA